MSKKFENETYFEFGKGFENGYTVVPNAILNDREVSYKAQGIYVQILQYQNSPTHKVYMSTLQTIKNDGETSIRSGVNELIKRGYIERITIRNERGHMKGYRYVVHDRPIENTTIEPKRENHVTENPESDSIAHINKIGFKENKKKENIEVEEEAKIISLYYETFKLEKRKMPHTLKLLKGYASKFDIELWEEIFISASGEDVANKFKYIRTIIEDLVKDNIYTLNEYKKRADQNKSTNKPNNSIPQNKKKYTRKSSQYMCDTKSEINGELKSFDDMSEDDVMLKLDIKNGTNYTGKNPNFRKKIPQACDIG